MSIPAAFNSFKSAGVYKVVYDKSTILNENTNIMRLVVGYSAQGPFNVPVLVRSISEFKALFGEPSKSLEKRGIFFHRIALQALLEGPIICLNLKRFSTETVMGATIDSSFNPSVDATLDSPIDVVELKVEDIYDTTRFWELSAFKLAEIQDISGRTLDGYISLSATNTKNSSCSFFIRKASGQKVAGYDITVNDWYKDSGEEIPEFLQDKLNSKISDFFAEIYLFKGQFTPDQVLTSETLKNYFRVVNTTSAEKEIKLADYVLNAYGEPVDTLDALFNEPTSGALNHYIGCLIPYFKDKQNTYQALDILVNNDVDTNNVMMNLNVDMLEDGQANIDLSGRTRIPVVERNGISINKLFAGTAQTTVLGNVSAPVISDEISFEAAYQKVDNSKATRRVTGNFVCTSIARGADEHVMTFEDLTATPNVVVPGFVLKVNAHDYWQTALQRFGITETRIDDDTYVYAGGVYCENVDPDNLIVPEQNVVSITNYSSDSEAADLTIIFNPRTSFALAPVAIASSAAQKNKKSDGTPVENVYGSSVSFVPTGSWTVNNNFDGTVALVSTADSSLAGLFAPGDCIIAADATTDADNNGTVDAADGYYDNVYVQEVGNQIAADGVVTYYVKLSGAPYLYLDKYVVRIDNVLNQEIGIMKPVYLEGYTYQNAKPASTSMYDKQKWQDFILSTLTDYKGIRTGLLNKADSDYRYIVDTFESFVTAGCKNILSFLCKEKQSALGLLNFPSVRTFVKCPYTSFTDNKGIFNPEFVVKGYNPKKSHTTIFSLPSDSEGASFCGFYTPLRFSDGTLDSFIPSAGLVSNLFVEKYRSRHPYDIVAGPNYGSVNASGMIGPDYNFSRDELNVLEPYGVNCMVYVPGFGTFINANQTAKQTPKSALSYINVRELVIFLQDEIENLLQSYQWDFNNQTLRNKIKDKADTICARVQSNGGIIDFVNIMNESNNTPDIIDNEMAVLSTHIEPGHGAGKMIHELTLYRTGQMRSAIYDA